jgi:hypothetical protein
MLTLDMQPAQELRGMQGADWWCLDLQLSEVSATSCVHVLTSFQLYFFPALSSKRETAGRIHC